MKFGGRLFVSLIAIHALKMVLNIHIARLVKLKEYAVKPLQQMLIVIIILTPASSALNKLKEEFFQDLHFA
jgi:hypothetical protein